MFHEGFDCNDATAITTHWTGSLSIAATPVHQPPAIGNAQTPRSALTGALTSPAFATGHRWIQWWQRANGALHAITLMKGGVATLSISTDHSTGIVAIRRGTITGTVLAASAAINPSVPHILWVYADPKSIAGDVRVFLELSVTPLVSYTGDTAEAATDDFDQVYLNAFFGTAYFDDIAILTDAEKVTIFGIGAGPGNPPNRELFEQHFIPTGNGTVQFTPSAGANWENVVERPMDTANYNEGAAAGLYDLYTWGGMGFTPSAIAGAKVFYYGSRDGVITGISTKLLSNVTTVTPAAQGTGPAGVSALREDYFMLDPDTSALWTVGGIDATQFGAQLA